MSDFDEMMEEITPSVSFDFAGFQRMINDAKADPDAYGTKVVTLSTANLSSGTAAKFDPAWIQNLKSMTIPMTVICSQHIGHPEFSERFDYCMSAVRFSADNMMKRINEELGGDTMMGHLVASSTELAFASAIKLLVKSKTIESDSDRLYLAQQASYGLIGHFDKMLTVCQLLTWLASENDLAFIPYGWDGFTSGTLTLPLQMESLVETIELVEAFRFLLHMAAVTSSDEHNNDFDDVGDEVAKSLEWDREFHESAWLPKLLEAAPSHDLHLPTMPNFDELKALADEEE